MNKSLQHLPTNIALVEVAEPLTHTPPHYKVMLLNDDFTPMEFVVELLQHFFGMGRVNAQQVTMQIHSAGRGACGVYTRDIAETKVYQVNDFARQNEYPLLCTMEVNP